MLTDRKRKKYEPLAFEESLGDAWVHDRDIREVPIGNRASFLFTVAIIVVGSVIGVRVFALNTAEKDFYGARAESNLRNVSLTVAPRGMIYDRTGAVLAENKAIFTAILNPKEFLRDGGLREKTLAGIESILGIAQEEILSMVRDSSGSAVVNPIVIAPELTQSELVQVKALNLPTLNVIRTFKREYPEGVVFASAVGYTSFPTGDDLKNNPTLMSDELVGRMGIESFYDTTLRGTPGTTVNLRDAQGNYFENEAKREPKIGASLTVSLDGEFQKYFYERFRAGLQALGRTAGVGLAMDPQTGEVLAFLNFPAFDNNVFVASGKNEERRALLTSPLRPLFNRAVSGLYTPGSTVKPLMGVAALKEGVIAPDREIFSPGYLDIPNPYDPEKTTRFLDWRFQGDVNLAAALAQSSNVYFYTVGGGANGIKGLGIMRLQKWWEKFGLGSPTGIDIPGEAKGFLPSPEWKEKNRGRPWLLGDTYNVSIGQGDLLLTPVQLLSYIAGIANGGSVYAPRLAHSTTSPKLLRDLSSLAPEIREVQKGMRRAVTNSLGTAFRLNDLPFPIAAKTGSAQIQNNAKENAFFVGYIPNSASVSGEANDANTGAKIAILILIEESKEGSLNAVPIAKDVLNWYYENRIKKQD